MPEKLTSRLKDAFSSVFGENGWLITNWMRENVEIDDELDDSQDRKILIQILDSFEGKINLDSRTNCNNVNSFL